MTRVPPWPQALGDEAATQHGKQGAVQHQPLAAATRALAGVDPDAVVLDPDLDGPGIADNQRD